MTDRSRNEPENLTDDATENAGAEDPPPQEDNPTSYEDLSSYETAKPAKSRSATAKVAILLVLALLMLLPVSWLLGLVRERQGRLAEATHRIESSWGGAKQLHGPLLYLPYSYSVVGDAGQVRENHDIVFLAPTELAWRASLDPEVRSLGIFDALLYRSDVEGRATFDLTEIAIDPDWIEWGAASVVVSVGDPRGIDGTPVVEWNERPLEVVPAVEIPGLSGFGAHLPRPVQSTLRGLGNSTAEAAVGEPDQSPPKAQPEAETRVTVDVRMSLAGSRRLTVVPSAADTRLDVDAPWPSPSFVGAHLPRDRNITEEGFSAQWQIPGLARTLPRRWSQHRQQSMDKDTTAAAFGVELMLPAGSYQRTERAAKYALLFVGLTFLAFFLFEVLSQLRLHPIQYLLVAGALVVFYLLLLALSEHVGFNLAYAVAALATCGLIAGYSRSVLGSGRRAGIVLFELGLLYGYLYIVLAAEDFALLFGATGLFAVLGVVMWLTRHLDWYEMGNRPLNSPG